MLVFEPGTELFAELPSPGQPAQVHALADARARAVERMKDQLAGQHINQGEGRAVGHEWLRRPELASPVLRAQIEQNLRNIRAMDPKPAFKVLLIGIGGSALGVQMVSQALVSQHDRLICLDNADPRGIVETLEQVDPKQTLVVVVSKSGNTAETLSAYKAAKAHWESRGENFEASAIAVNDPNSKFSRVTQSWRARFDIWPWVGGRFCVTSPAGLVPLRLLGVDIEGLLKGAAQIDAWTDPEQQENFALDMAHCLFARQQSGGLHSVALLAYRDRLRLLGRYVQQLFMESLGKDKDLDGTPVQQGLSVFGERGSTDQHSILQYLTQGRPDTLTMIVESRQDAPSQAELSDEHMARALGTRQALAQAERPPIFLSIPDLSAKSIGALVALFERCVGYYAGMANINAYDQPGVESGKKASHALVQAKGTLGDRLSSEWQNCQALAEMLELPVAVTWRLATQLVAQGQAQARPDDAPGDWAFRRSESA